MNQTILDTVLAELKYRFEQITFKYTVELSKLLNNFSAKTSNVLNGTFDFDLEVLRVRELEEKRETFEKILDTYYNYQKEFINIYLDNIKQKVDFEKRKLDFSFDVLEKLINYNRQFIVLYEEYYDTYTKLKQLLELDFKDKKADIDLYYTNIKIDILNKERDYILLETRNMEEYVNQKISFLNSNPEGILKLSEILFDMNNDLLNKEKLKLNYNERLLEYFSKVNSLKDELTNLKSYQLSSYEKYLYSYDEIIQTIRQLYAIDNEVIEMNNELMKLYFDFNKSNVDYVIADYKKTNINRYIKLLNDTIKETNVGVKYKREMSKLELDRSLLNIDLEYLNKDIDLRRSILNLFTYYYDKVFYTSENFLRQYYSILWDYNKAYYIAQAKILTAITEVVK